MSAMNDPGHEDRQIRRETTHTVVTTSKLRHEETTDTTISADWPTKDGTKSGSIAWGRRSKRQQQLAVLMLDDLDEEEAANFEFGIRDKILLFFDDPAFHPAAKCLSILIMFLIFASIVTICLETVPAMEDSKEGLHVAETVCVSVFTIEFASRFICARKKARFLASFLNIVDILAILPFYMQHAAENMDGGFGALRAIRLVRVLRVMKMSKYTAGVGVLFKALQISMQPLAVLSFFVLIAVIIFSSLMYYIERHSEKLSGWRRFSSIPMTSWWCVVTMTTVGYGDMAPETTMGKTLGIVVMLSGVLLLALPITVIGANFTKCLRDSQVLAMEQALRDADNDNDGEVSVAEMENVLKKLARRGGSKEMLLGRGGTVRDLLLKYDTDRSGTFDPQEMARILQDFQMLCAGASSFQLDRIQEMRELNAEYLRSVLVRIEAANGKLDSLARMLRDSLLSEGESTPPNMPMASEAQPADSGVTSPGRASGSPGEEQRGGRPSWFPPWQQRSQDGLPPEHATMENRRQSGSARVYPAEE